MEYVWTYDSPLGSITLASDGEALNGLWFAGQKYYASTLEADHKEKPLPVFRQAVSWLDCYFAGRDPGFTPPLSLKTTSFRQAVWEILLEIPFGRTVTYGELAKRIALRKGVPCLSAQAVGGAVGHNAIALMIPCHRVLGADGSLTGYAGGLWRKRRLLEMEGVDLPPSR